MDQKKLNRFKRAKQCVFGPKLFFLAESFLAELRGTPFPFVRKYTFDRIFCAGFWRYPPPPYTKNLLNSI